MCLRRNNAQHSSWMEEHSPWEPGGSAAEVSGTSCPSRWVGIVPGSALLCVLMAVPYLCLELLYSVWLPSPRALISKRRNPGQVQRGKAACVFLSRIRKPQVGQDLKGSWGCSSEVEECYLACVRPYLLPPAPNKASSREPSSRQ